MSHFRRGVLALCVFLLSPLPLLLAAVPQSSSETSPRELVQQALRAEEQGLTQRRKELLDRALDLDPNYARAVAGRLRSRRRPLGHDRRRLDRSQARPRSPSIGNDATRDRTRRPAI